MVVVKDLLIGVAVGLALSLLEILPHLRRRLAIRRHDREDAIQLQLEGAATCKDVPTLLDTLEGLPQGRKVRLVGESLSYMDHTSVETISEWIRRETRADRPLEIRSSAVKRHPRVGPFFARFSAETASGQA